jgi:hypothetical protein
MSEKCCRCLLDMSDFGGHVLTASCQLQPDAEYSVRLAIARSTFSLVGKSQVLGS